MYPVADSHRAKILNPAEIGLFMAINCIVRPNRDSAITVANDKCKNKNKNNENKINQTDHFVQRQRARLRAVRGQAGLLQLAQQP
jgi:hypothetical protein